MEYEEESMEVKRAPTEFGALNAWIAAKVCSYVDMGGPALDKALRDLYERMPLQLGDAPLCHDTDPDKRLEQYLKHGFPLLARVDACPNVAAAAAVALGFVPNEAPHQRWGASTPLDSMPSQSDIGKAVSKEYNEAFRTLCAKDRQRFEKKAVLGRPGSDGKPSKKDLSTPKMLPYLFADARWKAGHMHVVHLGGEPPVDKPCLSTASGVKSKYLRLRGYHPGMVFGDLNECLGEVEHDKRVAWWLGRWGHLVTDDWCSPVLHAQIRHVAVCKLGYGLVDTGTEPSSTILLEACLAKGEHLEDLMEFSTDLQRFLGAGGYTEDMIVAASRRVPLLPSHRDHAVRRVALRATIRHGFSAEQLEILQNGDLSNELERLAVRVYGLKYRPTGHLCKGAIRRLLARSGEGEGSKGMGEALALLATDMLGKGFSTLGVPDHRSQEGFGMLLVALMDAASRCPDVLEQYALVLPEECSRLLYTLMSSKDDLATGTEHRILTYGGLKK